jgi:hypothetical protein
MKWKRMTLRERADKWVDDNFPAPTYGSGEVTVTGFTVRCYSRLAWKAGYDKAQRDARAKKRKVTK